MISSVVLLALGVAACTKGRSVTVGTGNGTATVSQSQDNQTTTVTTKEGTVTAGKGAVDPATLGVPVYPGAQANEGGSMAMSSQKGGGQIVTLKTSDPFDKVYAYYKGQMPANSEATKSEIAGMSTAMFKVGTDKAGTVVMLQAQGGTTTIMIEKFAVAK
jgi:hypothetical protein